MRPPLSREWLYLIVMVDFNVIMPSIRLAVKRLRRKQGIVEAIRFIVELDDPQRKNR
jgi:hypothetical protein